MVYEYDSTFAKASRTQVLMSSHLLSFLVVFGTQEQTGHQGLQDSRGVLPGFYRGTGGHPCSELHQEGWYH